MSSQTIATPPSSVYMNGDLSSVSFQASRQFQSQYDMNDPVQAMTEYARYIPLQSKRNYSITPPSRSQRNCFNWSLIPYLSLC
jgi:hypothetical protein